MQSKTKTRPVKDTECGIPGSGLSTVCILMVCACVFTTLHGQTFPNSPSDANTHQGTVLDTEQGLPGDSLHTSRAKNVVIEGMLIDELTGDVPDDDSITILVDSGSIEPDTYGNFSYALEQSDYAVISVLSRKYEPVHKTIALKPDQQNYFVTFTLVPAPTKRSIARAATSIDTAVYCRVYGYVVDNDGQPIRKTDGLVLLCNKDTVAVDQSNFDFNTAQPGMQTLHVKAPGFKDAFETIQCSGAGTPIYLTVPLHRQGTENARRQVTVLADNQSLHTNTQVAQDNVDSDEISRFSATMNDPLRVLHAMPGVSSENDVSSRCIIRGGEELETRIFVDGIPLLQPYHFGGVRSSFNQMAVENMSLYRSGYPSNYYNAQSGIIGLESKRPADDSLSIILDANILQYCGYLSVPLFRNRLGINASVQGSYYDFMVKSAMENGSAGVNPDLEEDINEFKDLINLPDYNDYSVGLHFKPGDNFEIFGQKLFNTDRFRYIIADSLTPVIHYYKKLYNPTNDTLTGSIDTVFPGQFLDRLTQEESIDDYLRDTTFEIIRYFPSYNEDTPYGLYADPAHPDRTISAPSRKTRSIDTLITYGSTFDMLYGTLSYRPNDHHILTLTGAWQNQYWDLSFPPNEFSFSEDTSVFDMSLDQYNGELKWLYSGFEHHLIHAGIQLEYNKAKYKVYTGRTLHEIITKGSINTGDYWGLLTGDDGLSATWDGRDSIRFYDITGVGNRIFIGYRGYHNYYNGSLFIEDDWTVHDRLHINGGVRLEASEVDSSLGVSPRLSCKYSLTKRSEVIAAGGHYTQNNYAPAVIALSEHLKPEKTWHASLGLANRFFPWLTQKVDLYGKYYYDLLTESATTRFTGSGLSPEELKTELYIRSDTTRIRAIARLIEENPERYHALFATYLMSREEYSIHYNNEGQGLGFGLEFLLRYEPNKKWFGWLSLSLSRSFRRNDSEADWTPFEFDRPLVISYVNQYRLPRRYEIGLKYKYMSGYPYTQVTVTDTLFNSIAIETNNSSRYKAYQRLDFRVAREIPIKRAYVHLYLELWNILNSPNAFYIDRKTNEIQKLGINIPFPALFIGCDFKF